MKKYILLINGYKKNCGYNQSNVETFSSFEFDDYEEIIKFIEFHRKHTREKELLTFGYEFIYEEGSD